jgi:hypothetical protein
MEEEFVNPLKTEADDTEMQVAEEPLVNGHHKIVEENGHMENENNE